MPKALNRFFLASTLLFLNIVLVAQTIVPENPQEKNYLNWLSKDYLQKNRIWKIVITQGIKQTDQAIRNYGSQFEAQYTAFGDLKSLYEWNSYSYDTAKTLIHHKALRKDYKLEFEKGAYTYTRFSYRDNTSKTPYKAELFRVANTGQKMHEVIPGTNAYPFRELYFDIQKSTYKTTRVCFNKSSVQLTKEVKAFNEDKLLERYTFTHNVTNKGFDYSYTYYDNKIAEIKSMRRGEMLKWRLNYNEQGLLKSIDRYSYGNKESTLEFFYNKGILKSMLDIDLKTRTMIITDIESYTY